MIGSQIVLFDDGQMLPIALGMFYRKMAYSIYLERRHRHRRLPAHSAGQIADDDTKSKGGGVCNYMNENWCTNFTVRSQVCEQIIELLCISVRPFYLPREFGQVYILLVYVPTDRDAESASTTISDMVKWSTP